MRKACGIFLLTLTLAAGCDRPGDRVGGINDVRVKQIDYALVKQMATARAHPSLVQKVAPKGFSGEYRVGAGDQIFVAIYVPGGKDSQELARIYPSQGYTASATDNYEVPQNGAIILPYIGEVELKDKTIREIHDDMTQKLSKFFKKPQVEIKVVEYNARHAVVAGEVARPGEQKITNKDLTVLLALDAAGGATVAGDLSNAELRYRDGAVEKIDLMAMLNRGDTAQNRVLGEGDVLYIPTNHRNKVFVMGELVKTEAQTIPKGALTLTEALNDAGGVDKLTASKSHIYVIRGAVTEEDMEPKKQSHRESRVSHIDVYQLDATDPAAFVVADQFMLQPRDVVYVSTSLIAEWGRFVDQLIPGSVSNILYGALYQ